MMPAIFVGTALRRSTNEPTKSSSGSVKRHRAFATHAMRPSPELLNHACRHLFQQPFYVHGARRAAVQMASHEHRPQLVLVGNVELIAAWVIPFSDFPGSSAGPT
jgi:hypothetical protein